jgi:glycosyltransferase involved in cell wall biosynthesis
MKLGVIASAYGEDFIGGAESAVREFVKQFKKLVPSSEVEVFTTNAGDHDWNPKYDVGSKLEEGILVNRFPCEIRDKKFYDYWNRVQLDSYGLTDEEEYDMLKCQGPYSPKLIEAVEKSDCDLFFTHPLLPIICADAVLKTKKPIVIHPGAHNEAQNRLRIYNSALSNAAGISFSTFGEQAYVNQNFEVGGVPQSVIGFGVSEYDGKIDDSVVEKVKAKYGIGDSPYILYVGRVQWGKGCWILDRFFSTFIERHPSTDLKCIFAGPVYEAPQENDSILTLGKVTEEEKWALLHGATALVNASMAESFSLVLIEAWLSKTPILVNSKSYATSEQALRSEGGFSFSNYGEFEGFLEVLLDEETNAELAENGFNYATKNYSWPTVISRYNTFFESLLK